MNFLTEALHNPMVILFLASGSFAFLRWIYRSIRDHEIQETFIKSMATNHLPHIYEAQKLICDKLGITINDPPAIQFVDFGSNGEAKKSRLELMREMLK